MDKKIKILYIITQSEFGGVQRYVFDLANSLNRAKFSREPARNNTIEVQPPYFETVIAAGENGEGELFKKAKEAGIRTVYLKRLKRDISPISDFLAVLEIYRTIKKECPDIVHLNSSKAGFAGALAAFIANFPKRKREIIFTAHGWQFKEPMNEIKKIFYLFLSKFAAKFQDKIICVSEDDCKTAIKNKIAPKEKLITIHNGIEDNIEFLPKERARSELIKIAGVKNPEIIIGTIANLYKTKGIDVLIEAASLAQKKSREYEPDKPPVFLVIGEGAERNYLEQMIKKYGLSDKLFLLGGISCAARYLKAFDIFVLPSRKEGLPYAALEAGLAELPLIASKTGGLPEIITHEENGLLFEPESARQLAEAILEMSWSEDLRKIFGYKIKEKIKKEFSLDKMVEETKKIY